MSLNVKSLSELHAFACDLSSTFPSCKKLVILRNPVSKVFTEWMNEMFCREEAFPELIALSLGVHALLGSAPFLAFIQSLTFIYLSVSFMSL